MSESITWQQIISKMRVSPDLLRWAQVGVWEGWTWLWGAAILLLLLGLLIRLLLPPEEQWSQLPRRPYYWAWGFAVLACVFWGILCCHVQDPIKVLDAVKSGATNVWQLSPDEVTELLHYLRTLAYAQILLAVVSFLWPITFIFRPSRGFRLLWQDSKDRTIDRLSYDNEDVKVGHELDIYKETLYIDLESRQEVIYATSHCPPDKRDTKWVHLSYDPRAKTLQGNHLKGKPEQDGEPCFGPDSTQPLGKVKRGKSFWVGEHLHFEFLKPLYSALLALAITVALAFFLSSFDPGALASPLSDSLTQMGQSCFAAIDAQGPDDPILAQLSYHPGDSATQPGWLVQGKLDVTRPNLVDKDQLGLSLSSPLSLNEPIVDVKWFPLPPLHVKLLFDLDRASVYNPRDNPLQPGVQGGARWEEDFWEQFIAELVKAFDFNGVPGQSDVGAAYAAWKCQDTDPGRLIYSPDDGHNGSRCREAESLSSEGMRNRIRHLVKQCLYLSQDQEWGEDQSVQVYEAQVPPEIAGMGVGDMPTLLVIVRWSDEPLKNDAYQILGEDIKTNSVFIVEIGRSGLPPVQLAYQRAIFVPAPTSSREFGNVDLQPLKEIVQVARENRKRLGFTFRFPYLLDKDTANNLYLMVENQYCQPSEIKLTWEGMPHKLSSSTSASGIPWLVRLSIAIAVVFFFLQLILFASVLSIGCSEHEHYKYLA